MPASRWTWTRQVVVTPWGEAVPFAVDARKREALPRASTRSR